MLKVFRGVLILTSILFICSFLFAQATDSTHKHDGKAAASCCGDAKCCKGDSCKRDAAGKCTEDCCKGECCKKDASGKANCCNHEAGKKGGCCGGNTETASTGASCSRKGGKCCGGMAGK